MKKIIFILLLISTSVFSQDVGLRIDFSNLIYGSPVNEPALNYKISFSDYYNGTYTRLGIEVERFPEIKYTKWVFCKIDQEIPITDNLDILPGVSFSHIYRPKSVKYAVSALSYSFNFEVTYKITNHLKLSVQATRERATDVSQIWRDSAYGGLIYYWGYDN